MAGSGGGGGTVVPAEESVPRRPPTRWGRKGRDWVTATSGITQTSASPRGFLSINTMSVYRAVPSSEQTFPGCGVGLGSCSRGLDGATVPKPLTEKRAGEGMACPLVGPPWETMLVTLCTEQPGGDGPPPRDFQFTFCPQPRETEAKHTFPIWIADPASGPASCAGISLNPFMHPAPKFPAAYSQGRKTGRFPRAGPSGGWGSLARPLFVPGREGHPGAEPGRGPGEQAGAGGPHPLSEGAGCGRREAAQAGDPGRWPRQRRAGRGGQALTNAHPS